MILIDLAVPRDIDPEIRKKENITLYDMDSFRTSETPKELADNLEAAGKIVKEQMELKKYSGKLPWKIQTGRI